MSLAFSHDGYKTATRNNTTILSITFFQPCLVGTQNVGTQNVAIEIQFLYHHL